MLVPISWLNEYIDLKDIQLNEYCDRMIMSGSNIEEAYKVLSGIKGIVLGRAVKVEKHPDADKLFVIQVDVGTEVLQIITGADNVTEGAVVPVILHGGVLPDGRKIKKGKLRGLESNGMLCSPEELGCEDKVIPVTMRDGIWILEDLGFEMGADFAEKYQVEEDVVDFEITPNRPDCLCMIGMAREASAVFERPLKYPEIVINNEADDIKDYIDVEIKRSDLCSRYVARAVKDVKVAPSPWWMQKRLMAAGVRPINNIVDITNYVMLEYGTPLHAFDINTVEGRKIIVDVAEEGEKFVTLDGAERILDKDSLLIKDAKKGIALAGIMGGLNSEIEDDTQTILIEAARFDPDGTRRTAKRLGMRTEASARFEKGVDANLCRTAADRVCQLVEMLGAGTVIKGAVDVYPEELKAVTTKVRTERVNGLLGIDLTTEDMKNIFEKLEIKVEAEGDVMTATPPTVRFDLLEEIDYVEEVARIYGYDNHPSTLPAGAEVAAKLPEREIEDLIKDKLMGMGLSEIQTYSFVSPRGVDKILVDENSYKRDFVKLINPLGEENSVMRTTLIPNMLEVLERNNARYIPKVEAFELGRLFLNAFKTPEGLPQEPKALSIGMYGKDCDFYGLKGVVESLLAELGIEGEEYKAEKEIKTFHPGRCASVSKDGELIGVFGEISSAVVEQYNLPERVYVAEIDFEKLFALCDLEILYKPIPKYPAMDRDIALVVKDEVESGEIIKVIKENGGELLERVELFDIYKGKQVAEGCKSMAYSLRYRDLTKTLTDEEIAGPHKKILAALNEAFGASLREE
ncbi:MAG: phenylalanine--tRNA ligase subunit beta [Clostridiales bacterium]|nr:phenylalanine--tRNA ligase subunit beta [Clostridiales bacterium]